MKKLITKISTISLSTPLLLLAQAKAVAAQTVSINVPSAFDMDFGDFFSQVLNFILAIAVLLVFFYLVWAGVDWITSGGDKGKVEQARNKITSAIIGLVVVIASYALLQLVIALLGISGETGVGGL